MQHRHAHISDDSRSARRLIAALLLNVGITVAQVVGGLLSGSLSLLADAAHNGSDAASLGVSYGARRISRRRADRRRTFGYERAELIGAMINLTTLFVIALYLIYVAVRRFVNPPEIEGEIMLIVGVIAFAEDAISAWLLHKESKESLNVRSAFIHMLADTLATLGVIVGALLVMFFSIYWIDPVITAAIAGYVMIHGYIEIRRTIDILMEGAPEGFDFDGLVAAVKGVDGVHDLHHVHVWRLGEKRLAMEAQIITDEDSFSEMERIRDEVKARLRRQFAIDHATLEITRHDPDHRHREGVPALIRDEP